DREVVGGRVERDEEIGDVVAVVGSEDLAPAATMLIDEEASRDREGPRHDLCPRKKPPASAVDLEHRLLHDVLRPRAVTRVPEEKTEEPRSERVVDLSERGVLAARIAIHRSIEGRILPALSLPNHESRCIRVCEEGRGKP